MKAGGGIALTTPDGLALFLKRGPEMKHPGVWNFPGGHADGDETPEEAARRETREESGHIAGALAQIATTPIDDDPTEGEYVTFRAGVPHPFVPELDAESSGYAWAPLDDPPEPLHEGVRTAIQAMDAFEVPVDAQHDGPWMSAMRKDGALMYRNRNIPAEAEIDGEIYPVDDILRRHEVPEWREMKRLTAAYVAQHKRAPFNDDRKAIYTQAHEEHGTPGERAYVEALGLNWNKWSAWARGQESKVVNAKPKYPAPDVDVKPMPHNHGELESTLGYDRMPEHLIREYELLGTDAG